MCASSPQQESESRSVRLADCAERVLENLGPRLKLGLPLGLGKPVQLVNELYERARRDSQIQLEIYTALSLAPPSWSSELERRLVQPLGKRLFEGRPVLRYAVDRRRGELPDNVRVTEFYLVPGELLGSAPAQRDYIASNYTHVVRDLVGRGINLLAQLVSARETGDGVRYSLSCNPDLSLDLMDHLEERRRAGDRVAVAAQLNSQLPYMFGDAELEPRAFDLVLDEPELEFPPYGPPNRPVGEADYLVGLYASALVADGGTLQLGIGTLSDAVSRMLIVRHQDNTGYRDLLEQAPRDEATRIAIARVGAVRPFSEGLFACSEMLVEGFLELYRAGILKREVYPHAGVQRALNEGRIGTEVGRDMLRILLEVGAVPERPDGEAVRELSRIGVLADDVRLVDGRLERPGCEPVRPDLVDQDCFEAVCARFLGRELRGGKVAHAGFFLGPAAFTTALRELPEEDRRRFAMTRISWVNRLAEDWDLKLAQRRKARFINETMMIAGLGAAVSDGLEDGRVVSGVGGQYNFVAMAHELPDARSILLLTSTRRGSDGALRSNIRWSYGHETIPRHLKDIVVTEYGIADLRGATDRQLCERLVDVMDARFQEDFVAAARAANKLDSSYRIPDHSRGNRPARVRDATAAARLDGRCPEFPFGTDLEPEEVELGRALRGLQQTLSRRRLPRLKELRTVLSPPPEAGPYLERMGLDRPSGLRERGLRAAVVYALALSGVI